MLIATVIIIVTFKEKDLEIRKIKISFAQGFWLDLKWFSESPVEGTLESFCVSSRSLADRLVKEIAHC